MLEHYNKESRIVIRQVTVYHSWFHLNAQSARLLRASQ